MCLLCFNNGLLNYYHNAPTRHLHHEAKINMRYEMAKLYQTLSNVIKLCWKRENLATPMIHQIHEYISYASLNHLSPLLYQYFTTNQIWWIMLCMRTNPGYKWHFLVTQLHRNVACVSHTLNCACLGQNIITLYSQTLLLSFALGNWFCCLGM